MNNQIRELTSIVRALADQITSTKINQARNTPVNKEKNTHGAVNRDTLCDSVKSTCAIEKQQRERLEFFGYNLAKKNVLCGLSGGKAKIVLARLRLMSL